MNRFYSTQTSSDPGTLYQLKNRIDRRNVKEKVSTGFHATADFVDLVFDSYIVAGVMENLGIQSMDEIPARTSDLSEDERNKWLLEKVANLVDTFITNDIRKILTPMKSRRRRSKTNNSADQDELYNYATSLIQCIMLRRVFIQAISSGDGNRVLRHWRFAILLYHMENKFKYRLESFLLLSSTSFLVPPEIREEIKWGRFVNYSGGEGKNLAVDEVVELYNRFAKERLKYLGPNHKPEVVMKIGRTLDFAQSVANLVGKQTGVPRISRSRSKVSVKQDVRLVIGEIIGNSVLNYTPGRKLSSGVPKKFNSGQSLFSKLNMNSLKKWINDKVKLYENGKIAF